MEYHLAETYLEGAVLLIDKPLEWTSFDVVNKIRQSLKHHLGIKKIKVGHAGTLDPLATGLVIVCTGKATRQITRFQELEKEYEAAMRLGATTPSFDLETEIDALHPWEHITLPMVGQVLKRFTGDMEQLPPVFSAKNVAGKRAYEMARKGKPVELKRQPVQIHHLELLSYHPPVLSIKVICSKGTYIRALARDLGAALGSGAHLTRLRRTRIGSYHVNEATSLENFSKKLKLL